MYAQWRLRSTCICPVWSESSLSTWRKFGSFANHWVHSEGWSEFSLGAQSFCWFCHEVAQLWAEAHQDLRNDRCLIWIYADCLSETLDHYSIFSDIMKHTTKNFKNISTEGDVKPIRKEGHGHQNILCVKSVCQIWPHYISLRKKTTKNRGPSATTLTWMYNYEGYIQPKYCKCCMQEKLTFRLPWQPIKFSSLDLIHMVVRGLLKTHYCKTCVKIP